MENDRKLYLEQKSLENKILLFARLNQSNIMSCIFHFFGTEMRLALLVEHFLSILRLQVKRVLSEASSFSIITR